MNDNTNDTTEDNKDTVVEKNSGTIADDSETSVFDTDDDLNEIKEDCSVNQDNNSEESTTDSQAAVSKKRKWVIVVVSTIVAFLLLIGGYFVYLAYDNANYTHVPQAISKVTPNDDACSPFKEAKLECQVTWVVNDEKPRGTLVEQNIEPSTKTKIGETVTMKYSNGPAKSEFPNLVNVPLEEAKAKLYEMNVSVETVNEVDGKGLPAGNVVSASIEPGTEVANGTSVTLNISNGKVTLPDWEGKSKELVTAEAEQLGLNVIFSEEESEKPSGIVIGQTPKAGEVETGSDVQVVVSKAFESKEITVPDVIGKTAEQAQTDLAVAGFRHIKTVEVVSSTVTSPQVTHVVPGVGQTGKSEENIVIIVSKPQS